MPVGPTMSDRAALGLAVATIAGARVSMGAPVALGGAVVVVALVARRPWLLVTGAGLLASALGAVAWAGLADSPTGPVAGVATLLSDPDPTDRGVRFDARVGSDHYQVVAIGPAAGRLRDRAAGERVEVQGVARPASPDAAPWLVPRHIGSRLFVDVVGDWSPGHPAARLANALRRTLDRGALVLSPDQRALFAGFILGDDRAQSPRVIDDFRASGLTHLLAVSGQNVAFVLVVASPLLRRLGLRGRLIATLSLIAFFALITRFEPSVLRASVMAGLAAVAATLGREASGLRLLALAVTVLVVADPLLVHSLGFGLSVGASAGILVLAPAVARRLPGPRALATAIGVTIGAQLGVAPVLVPAFGGIPVASLPANLLAVPAAGPLVAWGMTGGVVAGLLHPVFGDAPAQVLHLPTGLLVGWISGVARVTGRLPLGELRLAHLVTAGLAGALAIAAARFRLPGRRARRSRVSSGAVLSLAAVVTAVVAVGHPVVAAVGSQPGHYRPSAGAEVWTTAGGDGVLVIDGRARASPLLEGLRRGGVRRLAMVVIRSSGSSRAAFDAAAATIERFRPPIVIAPLSVPLRTAGTGPPTVGATYRVGDILVVVEGVTSDRIDVRVTARSPP